MSWEQLTAEVKRQELPLLGPVRQLGHVGVLHLERGPLLVYAALHLRVEHPLDPDDVLHVQLQAAH